MVTSPPTRHWPALAAVLPAAFMDTVDVSIVNTALVRIQRDLGASGDIGQWVVAAYALCFAITLVAGGRLGDLVGRRRMLLAGVGGFVAASALAGAAATPAMLIAARGAQGLFGGIMVPQAMSVITTRFPAGRRRATALSLTGLVLGVATVSGPLIGGLLVSADLGGLGWRAIFYVNVPVGLAAMAAGWRWIPPDGRAGARRPGRRDALGVVLLAAASLLLIGPLVEGRALGWPPWLVGALLLSAPALAVFARHERRRERRGEVVLVPAHLLRRRCFSTGTALTAVVMSGTTCLLLTLTWGLQGGLGWTPMHTALTTLALPLGIGCTSQLTNWHGHAAGRRFVGLGAAVMAAGLLALMAAVSTAEDATRSRDVMPWLFVTGVGMGMIIPLLPHISMREVPNGDAGAASGVFNSAGQLGAALGAAVAGLIFFAGGPHGPSAAMHAVAHTLGYNIAALVLVAGLARLLPPDDAAPRPPAGPVPTSHPGGRTEAGGHAAEGGTSRPAR
ncbi:MFS transporter [Actinomadura napierensis]|uniref:MFS transporter n=1 Tax=Actinomadura napierensis TaxID=267854 RepID=A0ABP5KXZ3_9ACTN